MKTLEYPSLPSTNDELLRLAKGGACHGTVVVAKEQSAGKGTKGRSFFSPNGGIYMSVLLRNISKEALLSVTPAAAVAVYEALFSVLKIETFIKPVNDLYYQGKKVCGILTQAVSGGDVEFVVVGIGVNLFRPDGGFPEELKEIAGCLLPVREDESIKKKLIQAISGRLLEISADLNEANNRKNIERKYQQHLLTDI